MNLHTIKILLTLKNASLANKEVVTIEYSSFAFDILTAFYKKGIIQSFFIIKDYQSKNINKLTIQIYLRYSYNKPALTKLKFFSTPSKQKYLNYYNLIRLTYKKDIIFLSTNQGILTLDECKKKQIGGMLLFLC